MGLLATLKLLSLVSALGAQAILLPQQQHTSGSGRHSISTGPVLSHSSYHIAANEGSSPLLEEFNANFASSHGLTQLYAVDQPEEMGTALANSFIKTLHPDKNFRIQSAYHSESSNVYHSHYVQQINGKDVVNGLVNINVDLSTGQILSFGDSAWKGQTSCFADSNTQQPVGQMVFSTSESASESCVTSLDVAIPDQILDPRLALVSFISIGNPEVSLADFDIRDISIAQARSNQPHVAAVTLHNVPGALQPVPATLAYLQGESGELDLVWSFEYKSSDSWYESHVKADSNEPEPLMVIDWQKDYVGSLSEPRLGKVERFWAGEEPVVAEEAKSGERPDAIYRVFAWSVNDPYEGPRAVVVNPADKDASPMGWHEIPRESKNGGRSVGDLPHGWETKQGWSETLKRGVGMNFTDTRGNNVFAQANPSGGNEFELNYRPNAPGLNFTFPLHWGCQGKECKGKDIKPASYINVSTTELFFTCNGMHDLMYKYGFDEAAGNFQERNFHAGHKGLGNDAVVAMAQDGSGFNNANFATPPDGQRPRMRMYIWDGQLPYRDGSLEEGIVVHEYTHGVSTRLTGGPANSGCLPWGESGGMGEGWGDFLATMIRMHKKKAKDWNMGEWASGRAGGIRKYPYSTNHTINPFTYKAVDKMWEVHAIGEVWSEFIFVVAEALVKKHGFEHNLFPPSPGHESHHSFFNTSSVTGKQYPARGNTLAVQLVLDGMKLQPCRPSFLDARNAIIAADHALTGGDNYCTIFSAFADRGMGPEAVLRGALPWGGGFRTEDFNSPKRCGKSHNL